MRAARSAAWRHLPPSVARGHASAATRALRFCLLVAVARGTTSAAAAARTAAHTGGAAAPA